MKYLNLRNSIFMILLLLFPFFFYGGPQYHSGRLLQEIWDLGHLIFFGLMALALEILLFKIVQSSVRRSLIIVFMVTVCAGTIEIIQSFLPGRFATVSDFFYGLTGGVGILFIVRGFKNRNMTSRLLFLLAGISIFSVSLTPFIVVVYDEYRAQRDFPILSDFESSLDLSRWSNECKAKRVMAPVQSGKYSLQVEIPPGKYSGISLLHFPQNWNAANSLQFSVYNPDKPLMLNFRVHDEAHQQSQMSYHDRYNGRQQIDSGWCTIVIPTQDIMDAPIGREMNLKKIKDFRIFIVNNNENKVLYLDDVKLIGVKKSEE